MLKRLKVGDVFVGFSIGNYCKKDKDVVFMALFNCKGLIAPGLK